MIGDVPGALAPPNSRDAEVYLIGAFLLSRSALEMLRSEVEPEYFYNSENARICEIIFDLFDRKKTVDVLTVSDAMPAEEFDSPLAMVGSIAAETGSAANARSYAEIVIERAAERKLIQAGEKIVGLAHERGRSLELRLSEANELIRTVDSGTEEGGAISISDAVPDWIQVLDDQFSAGREITGVSTGLKGLDMATTGLHPGELIILAGRPGMGKTTLGMNIATNVAETLPVVVFSLEMPRKQLISRMVSSSSGASLKRIRRPSQLTSDDWSLISKGVKSVSSLKLWVDDRSSLRLAQMRLAAMRQKMQTGLSLILVDYLQLIGDQSRENETTRISNISNGLKSIAKDLDVPVIALCQLNRGSDKDGAAVRRPRLTDLRGSGSIEQDADAVYFIHRPDYYEPGTGDGLTELIIAKQRNDETVTVPLEFIGALSRFADTERQFDFSSPPVKAATNRGFRDVYGSSNEG